MVLETHKADNSLGTLSCVGNRQNVTRFHSGSARHEKQVAASPMTAAMYTHLLNITFGNTYDPEVG